MSKSKIILIVTAILLSAGGYFGYTYYQKIYGNAINVKGDGIIYIKTGTDLKELADFLEKEGIIKSKDDFLWLAEQKNLTDKKVRAGKYKLEQGWTNNELINMFRAGNELEVRITFNNCRTLPEMAGRVSKNIESDSVSLLAYMQKDEVISKYGFTKNTFITMFLPNTYNAEWDTSPEEFVQRMADEYKKFWSKEGTGRGSKLARTGLTQSQVYILASIVKGEFDNPNNETELKRIAGLYINRLQDGMKLESDPTVKFALGDPTIRRLLYKDLEVESPYNTYKHKGLPPGPINMPELSYLDAVLNFEEHNYIFMCAKPDNIKGHNFSKTLDQHNEYARQYRSWLNSVKIMR
jgi:UPF0755 protein